jgi:tetratricopeptide (TPR) repeat protein
MASSLRSVLVGLATFAGAAALNLSLASRLQQRPYDVEHVPSGAVARWVSLGQRGLVSDLYWLAAVQYIGEPHADQRGWDKLLALVDLVTDLDPRHGYAYQTAGIVLSAAGRLDESDTILKKGVEKGPPYWTFPYYLAFNDWFYRGDLAEAARWAEIAARKPGASPNISHLAVSLASKSGTPEQAIVLLEDLRSAVHDEKTQERLNEQLKLAILERDAQRLEHAVAQLEQQRGWPVTSLDELLVARIVPALPPDPFGGRYEWNAKERQVRSSANPFRFHLIEGHHAPKFQYQPPVPGARRKESRP